MSVPLIAMLPHLREAVDGSLASHDTLMTRAEFMTMTVAERHTYLEAIDAIVPGFDRVISGATGVVWNVPE